MTIHRAAWALRAAVVAALGVGLLASVATPAFADHDVRLDGVGNVEVQAGGSAQNLQLRVENRQQGNHNSEDGVARDITITMTVPGGIGAVIASAPNGCNLSNNNTRMDCTIAEIGPGQAFSGVVSVGANGNAPVEAGQSRDETGEVALSTGARQQFNVRVNGPDKAPVVKEVSGVVTDRDTGDPIEGAKVVLQDGQGVDHDATTNADGQYRFGEGDNIAPGTLGLRVSKDGYEFDNPPTLTLGPDESETGFQLVLINSNPPTPSDSPSPEPTDEPTGTPSPVAAEPTSSGGGFFTTLLIVLGVLFVALGIGAIVLLVIRQRRRAREEEDDDGLDAAGGPPPGGPRPGPTPGSRGTYRPTPTQVAGADQTQVLGPGGPVPAVGPRPALANAPTMMHRAAGTADETAMLPRADGPPGSRPGPPGSPGGPPVPRPASPQGATYGAAAPAGPYEGQRGYPDGHGSPAAGYGSPAAGYGSPAAGYGSPAAAPGAGGDAYRGDRTSSYGGYDQPTGRHERPGYPAEQSYGPDPYTQPAGGGHGESGYDRRAYEDRGYGGRGYDERGHDGRGHDGRGYDDRGGYDGRGYDDRGYNGQGYDTREYGGHEHDQRGYDRRGNEGYEGRGYDGRAGYGADQGYGQPAPERGREDGYHDEPAPPRHSGPPERRRLDWLD